jgi:hypothetical protein
MSHLISQGWRLAAEVDSMGMTTELEYQSHLGARAERRPAGIVDEVSLETAEK